LIQVVILIIWSSISPYASSFVLTDSLNLIGEYQCSTPFWGYYIIELCYIAALAGYGIFVIYNAWNLSSQANQVKWILITTYNYVLIFMMFSPLFVFLSDELSHSILAVLAILFLSMQSELCFFLPSFLVKAVKKTMSSRKASRTSTRQKSSDSVPTGNPMPSNASAKPITHAVNATPDGETTEPSEEQGKDQNQAANPDDISTEESE